MNKYALTFWEVIPNHPLNATGWALRRVAGYEGGGRYCLENPGADNVQLQSPNLAIVRYTGNLAPDDCYTFLCDESELGNSPTAEQLSNVQSWINARGYTESDASELTALTVARTWQQIIDDISEWMITP